MVRPFSVDLRERVLREVFGGTRPGELRRALSEPEFRVEAVPALSSHGTGCAGKARGQPELHIHRQGVSLLAATSGCSHPRQDTSA